MVNKQYPLISEELITFLIGCKSQQLSERTIEFYRDNLKHFTHYCNVNSVSTMSEISASIIRSYMGKLGETHNPGGVHCHFRCIRTFLNWYELETDAELPNPIRKIKPPKVSSVPIPAVPMSDVNAMITTCGKDFMGLRDKAILRTMIDTGLRCSEFVNLLIQDVNMENGAVRAIAGKGNKDRTVFLTPTARADIARYLRRRQSKLGYEPLWVTHYQTKLSRNGLVQIIIRRAKEAQLKDIPSPHDFRRTFAIESLRMGMDIVRLMYLMGHTTTTVLQRYLAIQTDDLQRAYEQRGSNW